MIAVALVALGADQLNVPHQLEVVQLAREDRDVMVGTRKTVDDHLHRVGRALEHHLGSHGECPQPDVIVHPVDQPPEQYAARHAVDERGFELRLFQ